MKKTLWLALILLLACVFTFSGCDNGAQPQSSNDTASNTTDDTENFQADSHDHSFGEWVTIKDATCTVKGEQERSCSCGETESQTIDATGHNEVIDTAITPTCTTAGKTEGKHCSVCNEVFVAQTSVNALGHTEVTDAAVTATCTTAGKTEGKHCSVCKEVLVAQEAVSITHAWVDATYERPKSCIVCGATVGEPLNPEITEYATVVLKVSNLGEILEMGEIVSGLFLSCSAGDMSGNAEIVLPVDDCGCIVGINSLKNFYIRAGGKISYNLDGKIKSIGSNEIYYNLDDTIKSIGGNKIYYNLDDTIKSIGSNKIYYNLDDTIKSIGSNKIYYNLNDTIKSIGNTNISYNFSGTVKSIGNTNISYNFSGTIKSIGSTNISYNFSGTIKSIGSTNISYNFSGTVKSIGNTNISYNINGTIKSIGTI